MMNKPNKCNKISKKASKKTVLSLQESLKMDDFYCSVCQDYPHTKEIYQCKNSHLLCHTCHQRIIEGENAICPVCRIKISRNKPCRSRIAESIISNLVVSCPNPKCAEKLHNSALRTHQREHCPFRPARCKFQPIGCEWKGVAKLRRKHEKICPIRSLDANAILKKTQQQLSKRSEAEAKRAAAFEADLRLVAALSKRQRNILVREVELKKKEGHENVLEAIFSEEIGGEFVLFFMRNCSTNNENVKDKKFDILRANLGFSKDRSVKTRIEVFLLPGPQTFPKFHPVRFYLTSEMKNSEVRLNFTPSQIEDLFMHPQNLRLVIFDNRNGKSPCFLAQQEFLMSEDLITDYSNEEMEDRNETEEIYSSNYSSNYNYESSDYS